MSMNRSHFYIKLTKLSCHFSNFNDFYDCKNSVFIEEEKKKVKKEKKIFYELGLNNNGVRRQEI